MNPSHVVTGGGRGVGRAIVERLLRDGASVVVIERDPDALQWAGAHPAGPRVIPVAGDAADEAVAEHAADLAEGLAGSPAGSTTRRSSAIRRRARQRRRCWTSSGATSPRPWSGA